MSAHIRALVTTALSPLLTIALLAVPAAAQPPEQERRQVSQPADQLPTQPMTTVPCPEGTPGRIRCGRVEVPVDWEQPAGRKTTVRVAVDRARGLSRKAPLLFVHGGGPGTSPYDEVVAVRGNDASPVTPAVRADQAIVGLEQRGVGDSLAVRCLTDAERQQPYTAVTRDEVIAESQEFARKCRERAGDVLPHVSTWAAAQDMAYASRVLGAKRINFVGVSYGTALGTAFSTLFPARSGRFVLDSAVPPNWHTNAFAFAPFQLVKGKERVLDAYLQDCTRQGTRSCPLGAGNPRKGVRQLRARLDRTPLEFTYPEGQRQPVDGRFLTDFIDENTVSPLTWAQTTVVLVALERGNVRPLQEMYGLGGTEPGTQPGTPEEPPALQTSNFLEANSAIGCLDGQVSRDLAAYDRRAQGIQKDAPFFGARPEWTYSDLECAFWPAPAKRFDAKLRNGDQQAALVVNSTLDSSTPIEGARALAKQLGSPLFVLEGVGHGLYGAEGNECLTRVVDTYLSSGGLPSDGARCRQDPQPSAALLP